MSRVSHPSGQSTAAKLKAMHRCVRADHGEVAADQWLAQLRVGPEDIEDETRLLPLRTLHDAAVAFEALYQGEEAALARVTPWLLDFEVCGVWAKPLRGAKAPSDAFARLDGNESEYGRTTRWETTSLSATAWSGVVHLAHDPALEADGALARVRAAELAAIPRLFGFESTSAEVVERGEQQQRFRVQWTSVDPRLAAITGAAAGAAAGASLAALVAPWPALVTGPAAAFLAGAVAWAFAASVARQRLVRAQAVHVRVLERGLQLHEQESRGATGDLAGTVVAGQYRIGARMGSGASGVIYRATRITDGFPVAIKLLRAATAHDNVASDRLRREAEALGLAWHPNVVEVLDHGHLRDGTSYLVMELLRGDSLATRLAMRGRFSPDELLPVALQLTDAMVAVHAAGVLHRDLKPSNVFLVEGPSGGDHVKVLDFGIARVEWEEMRITNVGAPLGTPGYMSPEQEQGGELDARSDVFALGAIFFECLTGEPPPAERAALWTVGAPLRAVPASGVQKTAVEVPPSWRALIERALAPSRDERFSDVRSLRDALRSLADARQGVSG